MLKSLFLSAALAITASVPAHSAGLNRIHLPDVGVSETVLAQNIAFRKKRSGAEKLKRLLKRHTFGNPITQDVKDATGDPNIVVFDHRGGSTTFYQCSYITYRGKRALQCD